MTTLSIIPIHAKLVLVSGPGCQEKVQVPGPGEDHKGRSQKKVPGPGEDHNKRTGGNHRGSIWRPQGVFGVLEPQETPSMSL